MKNFIISREGFPYIIILGVISLFFWFYSIYVSSIFIVMTLFTVFFFRNPYRKIAKNEAHILSPADGKILRIDDIYEDKFILGNAKRVTIFLSIFNVHVNKSPIDGTVKFFNYRPGKFIPAFKSHCSDINEKNTIGIENSKVKILVSQITGFIARRIVCWIKEGDCVTQGKNFGLIKFGSCTEIIVPDNVSIKVKTGQKVKGGITIIGEINNEN